MGNEKVLLCESNGTVEIRESAIKRIGLPSGPLTKALDQIAVSERKNEAPRVCERIAAPR